MPKKTDKSEDKKDEVKHVIYPSISSLDELLSIEDIVYDVVHVPQWKRSINLKTLSLGEMAQIRKRPDPAEQSALMLAYAWINPDTKRRVIGDGQTADDMIAYAQSLKAKSGAAFELVSNKVNEMHKAVQEDAKNSLS